jgi:hypothetical protein
MLFEETERRSKEEKANFQKANPGNTDFDFFQFIKSYAAENDLKVSEKLMLYLMDLTPGSSPTIRESYFFKLLPKTH